MSAATAGWSGRSSIAEDHRAVARPLVGRDVRRRFDEQPRAAAVGADHVQIAAALRVIVDGRHACHPATALPSRRSLHPGLLPMPRGRNSPVARSTIAASPVSFTIPATNRPSSDGLVNGQTSGGGSTRRALRAAGDAAIAPWLAPGGATPRDRAVTIPATAIAAAATIAAVIQRRRRIRRRHAGARPFDSLDCRLELSGGLDALGRIGVQRLFDDPHEGRRQVGAQIAEACAIAAGVGAANLVQRTARHRDTAPVTR